MVKLGLCLELHNFNECPHKECVCASVCVFLRVDTYVCIYVCLCVCVWGYCTRVSVYMVPIFSHAAFIRTSPVEYHLEVYLKLCFPLLSSFIFIATATRPCLRSLLAHCP